MTKIILRGQNANLILKQVGRTGPQGPQGPAGEGVPTGGTTGEVLTKLSNTDFDTEWEPVPSAPVTSVNGYTGVVVLDTDDIAEGANLYFTNTRAINALTGQNISIFNNDAGYLTGVDWGDIGGTLSNQADLQSALDDKADLSNVVTLTGNQTINGEKSFTGLASFGPLDGFGTVFQVTRDGSPVGRIDNNQVGGGGMRVQALTGILQLRGPSNSGILVGNATIDMNLPVTLSANSISTTFVPTSDEHLTNKLYVDNAVAGVGTAWGDITGTLSDQADLQSALDDKADSSDLADYLPLVGGTLSRSLTASSGVESILEVNPTINQSGSAGYNTLVVNPTETSTGSGGKYLLRAQVSGSDRLRVFNDGRLRVDAQNAGSSFIFEAAGYGIVGAAAFTTFLTRNTATADTDNLVRYRAMLETASGATNAYELSGGFTNITAGNQHTLLELKAVNSGSFTNVLSFNGVLGTLYGNLSMSSNQITSLADGSAADHAVNLSQLDGRLSAAQRTAIDALNTGTSSVDDIINALQA